MYATVILNKRAILFVFFGGIQDAYARNQTPTRLANLRLEMFTDASAPLLSSPLLSSKGAEARHFIPALAEVWNSFAKPNDAHDQHVSACLRALSDIYTLLDFKTVSGETPLFMNAAVVDELRSCIDHFLTHYSFLRSLAEAQDLLLWWMVSKHHSMFHIGYEAQFTHPSASRCYINEDFVRSMQMCGMSNRHARPADRRALSVAQKYAMGKSLGLFFRCD